MEDLTPLTPLIRVELIDAKMKICYDMVQVDEDIHSFLLFV